MYETNETIESKLENKSVAVLCLFVKKKQCYLKFSYANTPCKTLSFKRIKKGGKKRNFIK